MERVFFKSESKEIKNTRIYFMETQEYPEQPSDFYLEIRDIIEDGKPCWKAYLANKNIPAIIPTAGYGSMEEAMSDSQSLMNSAYMQGVITRYMRDYMGIEESAQEAAQVQAGILDELLEQNIIGTRTYNILTRYHIDSEDALRGLSQEDIKKIPHMNAQCIEEILLAQKELA